MVPESWDLEQKNYNFEEDIFKSAVFQNLKNVFLTHIFFVVFNKCRKSQFAIILKSKKKTLIFEMKFPVVNYFPTSMNYELHVQWIFQIVCEEVNNDSLQAGKWHKTSKLSYFKEI